MASRYNAAVCCAIALALSCAPAHTAVPETMPQRDTPTSKPEQAVPPAAPARWPDTRREDVVEVLHGVEVHDPYRWLEDASSPEARAWASAQDRFARSQLAALPQRDALKQRIAALSYIDRVFPPERRGQRYFYEQQRADQEKSVFYVREGATGEPRVLLDPNALRGMSVQAFRVSPDGERVAFRMSMSNTDDAVLKILDVQSATFLELDTIPDVRYSNPSWSPDGESFYYTRMPAKGALDLGQRVAATKVYRHRIGTAYEKDEVIFGEAGDPRVLLGADISSDGDFLFVYKVHGWDSTEIFLRDLRRGARAELRPLITGENARFYATAFRGRIYIHTNYGAERWRILCIDRPSARSGPVRLAELREVVAEDPEAVLSSYGIVGGHLTLRYLRRASTELKIATLDGKTVRRVDLPALGSSEGLVGDEDEDEAYYNFESFLQPPTIYRTSVRDGGSTVYAQAALPAAPAPYAVEQLTFLSRDGTQVTMFTVASRKLARDARTPWLLIGYGGFNVSVMPRFDGALYAWLEAGGAVGYVNTRGGGEYGEAWHRAGMLTHKQNAFDDFIAAAEHLVKERYTQPSKLAMWGGSNGGLLVSAVMTQRPELFAAVICQVPLTDMVRYHKLGGARGWTRELGSADDPEQFAALHAYSPYHRVVDGTVYPALLVLSADADDRVDPMHARKLTASVQHATTSDRPVWLRIEANAGHAGAGLVANEVELEADAYAFLINALRAVTH
jgi:prolyl oligopeptidase